MADGAGGTAIAAQAFVDMVGANVAGDRDWSELLEVLDSDGSRLGHGQTTAVVLSVNAIGITGISVGDSNAWLVGDEVTDLTDGQVRKPLVGAGCVPFAVHANPIGTCTLLVASDGLLRYAKQQEIARVARGPDLATAARMLLDLVRLPSGGLQDDVSIVLCRYVPM